MKNTIVTQWLLCSLGLWLLSQQCGQCFYDPGSQRWINRDPLQEPGGANLYTFIANAPVSNCDPLGLEMPVWEGPMFHPPPKPPPPPPPPYYPKPTYPAPGPETVWNPYTGQWDKADDIKADDGPFALLLPLCKLRAADAGLKAETTAWQAAGRALSNTISKEQRKLLHDFLGDGVKGARDALTRLNAGGSLPEGLTKQTLDTYKSIAQNAIKAGQDTVGAQAARLKAIDAALKQCAK
jgi:RHS repeat-associated protein